MHLLVWWDVLRVTDCCVEAYGVKPFCSCKSCLRLVFLHWCKVPTPSPITMFNIDIIDGVILFRKQHYQKLTVYEKCVTKSLYISTTGCLWTYDTKVQHQEVRFHISVKLRVDDEHKLCSTASIMFLGLSAFQSNSLSTWKKNTVTNLTLIGVPPYSALSHFN